MTSTVYFLIISLLVATFTVQAQCRKTVPWNSDNLRQANATNELQISRDLKLLDRALAKLDCQIDFVKMPWARSIVELETGRLDIIDGAYKTAERQHFAWYSNFTFDSFIVLFMRTEDINKYPLNNLQDIAKYRLRIGTLIGAIYGDEFNKLLANKKFARLIYPNSSPKALWNMLKLGRIDGVIAELHLGLSALKILDLTGEIGSSGIVVSTQEVHYIFSKKSVDLDFVKAVDRELTKLSLLDEIESIDKKHE